MQNGLRKNPSKISVGDKLDDGGEVYQISSIKHNKAYCESIRDWTNKIIFNIDELLLKKINYYYYAYMR